MNIRRKSLLAAAAAALMPWSVVAQEADRPLRMVVGFPPGGSADILARVLGRKLSTVLARPVVIDNRAGAGGQLGLDSMAQAAPDGNTIMLCAVTTQIIGGHLKPNSRVDLARDLVPVAQVVSAPHVLVVHPSVPARTLGEFTAWLKANDGKVNYASGFGTLSHLEGELLGQRLGVKLVNVPYKGTAQAVTDLLSGAVSFLFDSIPSATPFIKSGQVRGLAVASSKRVPALADLPTMTEGGVAGYDVDNWFGFFAPKGTGPALVQRIDSALAQVMADPAIVQDLVQKGYLVAYANAAQMGRVTAAEQAKWGALIKATGIAI